MFHDWISGGLEIRLRLLFLLHVLLIILASSVPEGNRAHVPEERESGDQRAVQCWVGDGSDLVRQEAEDGRRERLRQSNAEEVQRHNVALLAQWRRVLNHGDRRSRVRSLRQHGKHEANHREPEVLRLERRCAQQDRGDEAAGDAHQRFSHETFLFKLVGDYTTGHRSRQSKADLGEGVEQRKLCLVGGVDAAEEDGNERADDDAAEVAEPTRDENIPRRRKREYVSQVVNEFFKRALLVHLSLHSDLLLLLFFLLLGRLIEVATALRLLDQRHNREGEETTEPGHDAEH